MSPTPPATELLTPEDRWNRWEQSGLDDDALFMRRARLLFWLALVLAIGATVMFWLSR